MKYLDIDSVPAWYLQKAADDVLSNLRLYVRDTNLSADEAQRYFVGQIFSERGYTDASGLVGGIPTSHRFAILSNHMTDISAMSASEEVRSWGLSVAEPNARFKVLDISRSHGKTQILLLHLPSDERWRLFSGVQYDIEEEYVKKSLEDFTSNCKPQVIQQLSNDLWLDRCKAPLGFDADGTPFPVETAIEARLKPADSIDFREVAHNIVLLKSLRMVLATDNEASPRDWPDYLAFGFIDKHAGLCAQLLSSARVVDGKVEALGDLNDETRIIGLGDYKNLGLVQLVDDNLGAFGERISEIEARYEVSRELEYTRAMRELDHIRDVLHPDVVAVRLMTKKRALHDEQGKAMISGIENGSIVAELLYEPEQNMGIHEGDRLPLTLTHVKDGIAPVVLVEDYLEKSK